MPVQFYNLGFHLFQADASQQVQNVLQQVVRSGNEVAQAQVRDLSKQQSESTVQDTTEVRNRDIQGEGRGAHSHTLTPKREKESKKETTSSAEPPEDPEGRGQNLDLSM